MNRRCPRLRLRSRFGENTSVNSTGRITLKGQVGVDVDGTEDVHVRGYGFDQFNQRFFFFFACEENIEL